MATDDEIDILVREYNDLESQRSEVMTRLYHLLYARSGFRRVNFSRNHVWSNCWGYGDRLDIALAAHVVPHIHPIIEYNAGAPVPGEDVTE